MGEKLINPPKSELVLIFPCQTTIFGMQRAMYDTVHTTKMYVESNYIEHCMTELYVRRYYIRTYFVFARWMDQLMAVCLALSVAGAHNGQFSR